MIDPHRTHASPLPQRQRRKKPMHMVEIRQVQKEGTWKNLKSATCVRCVIRENPATDRIGDIRGQALGPPIPALLAAARDHQWRIRRSLARQTPQCGDVGRIVLPVAVQRRNPGCPRRPNTRAKRGTLSTISRVAQQPHLRNFAGDSRNLGNSPIAAAVIDIEDLVFGQTVECGTDLADERPDVFRLVLYRNDDRQIHEPGDVTPLEIADKSAIAGPALTKGASATPAFYLQKQASRFSLRSAGLPKRRISTIDPGDPENICGARGSKRNPGSDDDSLADVGDVV